MKTCPNCGKEHDNNGNQYCKICENRFAVWGVFDHLSRDGKLSKQAPEMPKPSSPGRIVVV